MVLNDRQRSIIELLKMDKSFSVKKLSEMLFFSASTIRRDLDALENANLVRRTHGGATFLPDGNVEIPLTLQMDMHREAKEAIARAAARFVKDGESLFMDSSSSVLYMAPFLADKKELTIVTNGLTTALELSRFHTFRIVCTGGCLREKSLYMVGEHARNVLEKYHVDKLFFSARNISLSGGVTDFTEDVAEIRKVMLAHANKKILLMDKSKIGGTSLCRICGVSEIDVLITDGVPKDREKWEEAIANLVVADK